MQVHGETTLLRQTEKPVEQSLKFWRRRLAALARRGHAQYAAGSRHLVCQRDTVIAGKTFQRTDADRLQVDPAGPGISHPAKDRPGPGIRPVTVEMRADRRRAVGIGATQTKLEARFDIGFRVVFAAISDDGVFGARMRAVRVGLPPPRLRLVEMHMPIDEAGPELASVQINALGRRSRWRDRGNPAIGDA